MYEKWMVSWVPMAGDRKGDRGYTAGFFDLASKAWACFETAKGSEVAIYRLARRPKSSRRAHAGPFVEWELMEYRAWSS